MWQLWRCDTRQMTGGGGGQRLPKKGLVTPRDYGFFFSENCVIEEMFKFFWPIFIILSDMEESIITDQIFRFLHFQSAQMT